MVSTKFGSLSEDDGDPEGYSLGAEPDTEPLVEGRVPTKESIPYLDTLPYAPSGIQYLRPIAIDIAKRLLSVGPFSFTRLVKTPFQGVGVYSIYYQGDIPAYTPAKSLGSTFPIYIGKSANQDVDSLYIRLRAHAKTLSHSDLPLSHLTFRFVCLPFDLVDFAESSLISLFKPLWNEYLTGFGGGKRFRESQRVKTLESCWSSYHSVTHNPEYQTRSRQDLERGISYALSVSRRAFEATMHSFGVDPL